MRMRLLVLTALVAFCLQPFLIAQDTSAKILGTITDQQGAVVAGAKIAVTNVATGIINATTTDKEGNYQVLHLPIGTYAVTIEHPGFKKVVTTAYTLEINQALRIDVPLQVGATTEAVEVRGDAAQIETQNSTLGNSVTSRPIVNLPLNGRNLLDLATLEPGVTEQNPGNGAAGTFSIAGNRTDSVSFLLDGGNNNSLLDNGVVFNPNPDTIAEFRILESNYGAEYGRNAGGILSAVTKSGTRNFHGSAFEFIRNDALDANSFFRKYNCPTATDKTLCSPEILKRNQFGATLGGPLFLPKDKSFFFVGYQGQRESRSDTYILSGMTDLEYAGNFSQSPYAADIAAYLEANPYYQPNPTLAAQGIIDPSRIDPIAKAYMDTGIIPHSATGSVPVSGPGKSNHDQFVGKLDFNPTERDHIAATLGFQREPRLNSFANGVSYPLATTDNFHEWFANIAYTKTLSPNVLNEFRVTGQRLNMKQWHSAMNLPTPHDMGILTTPDLATGSPMLWFDSESLYLGNSYRGPVDKVNNTFELTNTLTWVKGRHTMKYGFSYSPYQNNTVYAYIVNGEFDFYGYTTGSDLADFMLGAVDEYIQFGNAPSNIRTKSYFGFAQDEWRVTRNLTLTLGLRYEYNTPKRDTQGRSFSFLSNAHSTRFVNAPAGLLFPGDASAPDGANFPDRNNFAPRFGFAWDPRGNGKTSIRGGFGVFYDILKGEDNLQFNGQAPFYGYTDNTDWPDYWSSTGANTCFRDPYGCSGTPNPFPSRPPAKNIDFGAYGFLPFGGSSVYFVDPHLRTPYVYHYNLAVQHDLGHNLRLDVAYVGSTARKLTGIVDGNPFILGTANRLYNTQPGTDSNTWSYVDTFINAGDQNYNSLQTALKKTLSSEGSMFGGTYFTLAYTWSKNIDTSSGFRENNGRVKAYDHGADRTVSDMDLAHRITFSGGWDLPFHTWWGTGPKKLTKGWSLYPIFTWRTGFPIDLRAFLARNRRYPGPSNAGDSNMVRPNLVGGRVLLLNPYNNLTGDGALWVSPANFEWESLDAMNGRWLVNANPTYGTLARNAFRGPHRYNLDFAFAKNTQITERVGMEFRFEAFNAFNNTQFDNPQSDHLDITNPDSFGRITSTANPRELQFGIRFTF